MRGFAATVALAVGAFFGIGFGATAAQAQVPPIPVPAPPPEAAPVLELVSPTVSPVCGDAILAVVLGPALVGGSLGMPLPADLVPLFGPAFVICGSIPQPPQRLSCLPDATARGAIDQVTATAAGTSLPVDTSLVAPVVEELFVLQDTLGPPVSDQGVATTVAGTLTCTVIATPAAEETEPEPDVSPDTEFNDEEALGEDLGIPDLSTAVSDYSALGETSPTETQLGSAGAPIQPVFASSGFAYPIVFAIPLALLAIVGYFGWALTRPAIND